MNPYNLLIEFKDDMDAQFDKMHKKIDAVLLHQTCETPDEIITLKTELNAANTSIVKLQSNQENLKQEIDDVKAELGAAHISITKLQSNQEDLKQKIDDVKAGESEYYSVVLTDLTALEESNIGER
jgi:chromosome segregation ATPase